MHTLNTILKRVYGITTKDIYIDKYEKYLSNNYGHKYDYFKDNKNYFDIILGYHNCNISYEYLAFTLYIKLYRKLLNSKNKKYILDNESLSETNLQNHGIEIPNKNLENNSSIYIKVKYDNEKLNRVLHKLIQKQHFYIQKNEYYNDLKKMITFIIY